MDIEKLKRCLKCCADDNSKACNKCELEYGEEECQNLCGYAATALSALQAENEKLRAELERVKRERDAVLNAFRGFIQSGHLCEYCAETLKDNPACSACEKWSKFQWRGAAEE